MKKINFPIECYFSIFVEESISEDFQQLIDNIFIIGKLKGCKVETIELAKLFNIVVKDQETKTLNIFFHDYFHLDRIEIDYNKNNLEPIDVIKNFIDIM